MKVIWSHEEPDGAKIQMREFTKADAKKYLASKAANRVLCSYSSDPISRLMNIGRFKSYVDFIHFLRLIDGTEVLINGQHRMTAFGDSEAETLRCASVVCLEKDVSEMIDTGRTRKAGDVLAIMGYRDGNVLAGAVNAISRYRDGSNYEKLSPSEIILFVSTNESDLARASQEAMAKEDGYSMGALFGSPSLAAALLFFIRNTTGSWERAAEFAKECRTGIGLSPGNPVLHLRKALQAPLAKSARSLQKKAPSAMLKMAIGAKAAGYWIDGAELFRLAFTDSESWPIADGKINIKDNVVQALRVRGIKAGTA